MTRRTVLYIKNRWHSRNVDVPEDYQENHHFGDDDLLITFQSSELIKHLKTMKRLRKWPEIVDLEGFDKQMTQEGKDLREPKKWKMMDTLKYHNISDSDFLLSETTSKRFLGHMAIFFELMLDKNPVEAARFLGLETKVNRIIYRRQLCGVPIDMTLVEEICANLEKEIYRVKNVLQLKYRIFNPDNEHWQMEYLAMKGFKLIKSPLFTFKSWRNEDEICNLMYNMMRNKNDFDSLLFMHSHWGGKTAAYPKYVGFGTITSRITLRDPSFQNLRKTNRKVVVPDSLHRLLYIDYSQFEAGILASLSDDPKLIDLYNKDIYENLAAAVFGDPNKRSDAKVVFYRYMYGDTTLSGKAQQFFKKFTQLEAFKEKIDKIMVEESSVGTTSGNFRVRGEGHVTWALSHVIQATASLIYKNALVRVADEVDRAKFLIPMHDGTVYQIFDHWYDYVKAQIEKIYLEEFQKVCPKLICKVNTNELFE